MNFFYCFEVKNGREHNINVINELNEKAVKEYYNTPLSEMKRRDVSFYDALVKSAETIKSLDFI